MNRIEFQRIAELRLREAKALLAGGFPDGAYYLAGYGVECALKACIAKHTREHDFPERAAGRYYSHNVEDLLRFAQLELQLDRALQTDPVMRSNWIMVKNWSEESRYEAARSAQDAQDLLNAIEDQPGGILPWVRLHW